MIIRVFVEILQNISDIQILPFMFRCISIERAKVKTLFFIQSYYTPLCYTVYDIFPECSVWEDDFSPIDPDGCDIDRIHSKAYLHHLFKAQELLAMQIASIHNLAFYLRLVTDARQHIANGDFTPWKRGVIEQLGRRR